MKKLLVAGAILFLCGVAKSQIYTPTTPTTYGHKMKRVMPTLVLHTPEKDSTILSTKDSTSQIFLNKQDSSFWGFYKPRGYFKIGGGGSDSTIFFVSGLIYIDSLLNPGFQTLVVDSIAAGEGGTPQDLESVLSTGGTLTNEHTIENGSNLLTINSGDGTFASAGTKLYMNANEIDMLSYRNEGQMGIFQVAPMIARLRVINNLGEVTWVIDGSGDTTIAPQLRVTGLSTGAGYVLTDVTGTGLLTLEPPPSGGGGGGGGSDGNGIYSGSGSLADETYVDMNAWNLSFIDPSNLSTWKVNIGGQEQISADPSISWIQSVNTTTEFGNVSKAKFSTLSTEGRFEIYSNFNDGGNFIRILGISGATTSTLSLRAGMIEFSEIQEFTDNADALSGSLEAGAIYRTGDVLKIVH